MHPTAGLFIFNKKMELLLCHPTNHPETLWSMSKGGIEEGEEPLAAAIRETFEETNIDVSNFDTIHKMEVMTYANNKKLLHPFIIFASQNPNIDWDNLEIKCNSNVEPEKGGFPEMDAFKWVPLDEAFDVVHECQARCLEIIKKNITSVKKKKKK